jgi:hypothetical protein
VCALFCQRAPSAWAVLARRAAAGVSASGYSQVMCCSLHTSTSCPSTACCNADTLNGQSFLLDCWRVTARWMQVVLSAAALAGAGCFLGYCTFTSRSTGCMANVAEPGFIGGVGCVSRAGSSSIIWVEGHQPLPDTSTCTGYLVGNGNVLVSCCLSGQQHSVGGGLGDVFCTSAGCTWCPVQRLVSSSFLSMYSKKSGWLVLASGILLIADDALQPTHQHQSSVK